MKRCIIVRARVEGWHKWPEAPVHRAYLRQLHHHYFRVEFEIEVKDEGREIEFHDFRKMVKAAFERAWVGNQTGSCETLARTVGEHIEEAYPGRWWSCRVWEDSECGARVESE